MCMNLLKPIRPDHILSYLRAAIGLGGIAGEMNWRMDMMFFRLLKPFALGVSEAGLSTGITYDDDPESPRSRAYDRGRNLGDLLSGRR